MPTDSRSPVTVLGLGAMGRALAGAFLDAGFRTTVWNRTASKADALVARGAIRAATAAEAVTASPLTVICVIDYAAAETIVAPVADALKGRTLVNLTADTPERARAMAAWAADHGIGYLDGAIMVPTEVIGTASAVVLYSGPEELLAEHRPVLEALGGTPVHLGADPGRAAAHDVALLDLFWTSMAGVVHAFALASAENIAAKDLAPLAKGIGALLPPSSRSSPRRSTRAAIPATTPRSGPPPPGWTTSSRRRGRAVSTRRSSAPPGRSPSGRSTPGTARTASPAWSRRCANGGPDGRGGADGAGGASWPRRSPWGRAEATAPSLHSRTNVTSMWTL